MAYNYYEYHIDIQNCSRPNASGYASIYLHTMLNESNFKQKYNKIKIYVFDNFDNQNQNILDKLLMSYKCYSRKKQ